MDGERKQSSVNLDIVSQLCCVWEYLADIPPVPRAPGDAYMPQIDGNYTLPAGPPHKDYGDDFTDGELDGIVLHPHADHEDTRHRVFFVPPTPPAQPTQSRWPAQASQSASSGWRSRWKRWTDRFRSHK